MRSPIAQMNWPARRLRVIASRLVLAVWGTLVIGSVVASAQPVPPGAARTNPQPPRPKLGLLVQDARACPGYTLLAPTNSTATYLIDMQGRVVRTWKSDY